MFGSENNNPCAHYWREADEVLAQELIDEWCQGDNRCMIAKKHALLSACKNGIISWSRSDGKPFDDTVEVLYEKRLLLIDKETFCAWATEIDGGVSETITAVGQKTVNKQAELIFALASNTLKGSTGKASRDASSLMPVVEKQGISISVKTVEKYLKMSGQYES